MFASELDLDDWNRLAVETDPDGDRFLTLSPQPELFPDRLRVVIGCGAEVRPTGG